MNQLDAKSSERVSTSLEDDSLKDNRQITRINETNSSSVDLERSPTENQQKEDREMWSTRKALLIWLLLCYSVSVQT